jgi:hypothetical protein
MQCTYKRNVEARSSDYCCRKIALSITYSEYAFVDLVIQRSMGKRHIVICGVAGSATFSVFSHKRPDFRGKVTEHKMCVLIFSTTFCLTHLSFL